MNDEEMQGHTPGPWSYSTDDDRGNYCRIYFHGLGRLDAVKITRKWGRWQHHVDYRPFKRNKLIRVEE